MELALINTVAVNPTLFKTGVKLNKSTLFCSSCTIGAKGLAIDASNTRSILTGASITSAGPGSALNLVQGTLLWGQQSDLTGETLATISAGSTNVKNSQVVWNASMLRLLTSTPAAPAFKALFLGLETAPGDLKILGSKISNVNISSPEFIFLKQLPGSKGNLGSLMLDNQTDLSNFKTDGEKVVEEMITDYSLLTQIFRCDNDSNPVVTRFDPYYFCGGGN